MGITQNDLLTIVAARSMVLATERHGLDMIAENQFYVVELLKRLSSRLEQALTEEVKDSGKDNGAGDRASSSVVES